MAALETLGSKPKVFCPVFKTIPIVVLRFIYLFFLIINLLLSCNVLYDIKTSRLSIAIAIKVNLIPIIVISSLYILSIFFLSYLCLITFAPSEAACKVMLVAGYAIPVPFPNLLIPLYYRYTRYMDPYHQWYK